LNNSINVFQKKVGSVFDGIFDDNIKVISETDISKEEALRLLLIEKLFLFFNQINNNGPVAFKGTFKQSHWLSEEKLDACFMGYKYAVQYTWKVLLGGDIYNSSSLKEIHKTDSWRDYEYNKSNSSGDKRKNTFNYIYNRTYDLDKQTCFDSYFRRIQRDIIWTLEKKYNINFTRVDELFATKKTNYTKSVFQELFSQERAMTESLTIEEELDMSLYWYPVEIVDENKRSGMHVGVPAFVTFLSGVVGLFYDAKDKEFEQVIVRKFIHPRHEAEGNNYSYGILIDSMASAGHYSSGWMLYYDCCGDYSGFSGGEYQHAEKAIKRYRDKGILDFREHIIEQNEFKRYIAKYIEKTDGDTTEKEIEDRLELISDNRKERTIIADSKGLLLELISY